MRKYTQGPWKCNFYNLAGLTKLEAYISSGDEEDIAYVKMTNPHGEANKRLIMAAPDLLEAAEAAYREVFESDPESKVAQNLARAIALAHRGNHE